MACSLKNVCAQYYFSDNLYYDSPVSWELGFAAGGMNCFTDLGGNKGAGKGFLKDLNLSNTRLCGSAYLTAMYRLSIGTRLELTYGQVTAHDSILAPGEGAAAGRYQRNLSFRSPVWEASLLAEIHPLSWIAYNNGQALPRWSPYMLGGVGLFAFNPKAKLNGNWFSLNDLRTEGQGFAAYAERRPYRLTQCNVPLGVGLKYELSTYLNARLEVVHRVLFTDYLDDVSGSYVNPEAFYLYLSPEKAALATQLADRRRLTQHANGDPNGEQRGNPAKKDAYFSVQLKMGLLLNRIRAH
jgi:hypothetical protein